MTSPTADKWFHQQAKGMQLRIGVSGFQNEVFTFQTLLALDSMIDDQWWIASRDNHHDRVEELMTFVLVGFGVGLQGKEVPLVSMRGLLYFWDESWLHSMGISKGKLATDGIICPSTITLKVGSCFENG